MTLRLWAADGVAVIHAGFAEFLVLGLAAMLLALVLRLQPHAIRLVSVAHAAAAVFIALRVWLGIPCPLGLLDNSLRGGAFPDPVAGMCHRIAFEGADARQFRTGATLLAIVSCLCGWHFSSNRGNAELSALTPEDTMPARKRPSCGSS